MSRSIVFRGLAVASVLALVAVQSVTALAQTAPVRVVQGSDGTLYVVQSASAWTLVPSQISDSDLAAFALSGEIDGTIPAQLVGSAPSQVAAPAAAPAAPVDKLVRNYSVNYGAQSLVSISGGQGGYTVTAKGPLHWRVVGSPAGTPTCDLPDGTIIATFSQVSDGVYQGQHGVWDKNCQFQAWGGLNLTLKGALLTGQGYTFPVSFSPA